MGKIRKAQQAPKQSRSESTQAGKPTSQNNQTKKTN